jgi:two-component sensor histidine kinase
LVSDVFRDSQNRIRSMALVHENLYQSGNLARITFGEYVRSLLSHLLHSYGSERIRSEVDAEPVTLSITQAIPVGLMVNELVSNAFKHAFPGGKTGMIRIQIRDEGGSRTKIVVSDTGVGLPEGFRIDDARTLGVQLISTLTDQVGGRLAFSSSDAGTTFEVSFPRE